jgi:general secretion pathway protein H
MSAAAPHRRAVPSREAGFTLMELIIVIALLVVASGFVIMNLEGVTAKGRLRKAGRDLAAHLRYARNFAVLSGKPIYVYYDLDESDYYLTREYYGQERGARRHEELRASEHVKWETPRGVRIVRVESVVTKSERFIERFDFTPFGACVSHHVYLKGPEEDDWVTVAVNGLTGRVAVHLFYKEFDGVAENLPGL